MASEDQKSFLSPTEETLRVLAKTHIKTMLDDSVISLAEANEYFKQLGKFHPQVKK